MKTDLKVRVETDKETGKVLAVYLRVRKGEVAEVREVVSGAVFVNYGSDGQLLGVEVLAPCRVAILDRVARREPEEIREFLRAKLPREMKACA